MPVLGTKLHLPMPRRQLVTRARLTDRLRVAPRSMPRLVLVSAPAGFGKTTLLTQWLAGDTPRAAGDSPRVAWLSLDDGDADVGRFVGHLVAAVRTTSPALGLDALAMLEHDDGTPPEAVLASLVNDLDTAAEATVVVLDDLHRADDAAVTAAVTFLLGNLPPQVTLAIGTRADPPLPIARLRARGELVEVRASDLRFTSGEAELFLNEVMGLALEPDHVTALESRTEGWAAGLQLAGLAARGRNATGDVADFVDAFTGSHRFVLDYLLDDVLHNQPPDVRAFLLDTSVLHELTGPLCDAVTAAATLRRCSSTSSARTCSSSRSTTTANGSATTISSARPCGHRSPPGTRSGRDVCIGPPPTGTPTTAWSPTPCPTPCPGATSSTRPTSSSSCCPI